MGGFVAVRFYVGVFAFMKRPIFSILMCAALVPQIAGVSAAGRTRNSSGAISRFCKKHQAGIDMVKSAGIALVEIAGIGFLAYKGGEIWSHQDIKPSLSESLIPDGIDPKVREFLLEMSKTCDLSHCKGKAIETYAGVLNGQLVGNSKHTNFEGLEYDESVEEYMALLYCTPEKLFADKTGRNIDRDFALKEFENYRDAVLRAKNVRAEKYSEEDKDARRRLVGQGFKSLGSGWLGDAFSAISSPLIYGGGLLGKALGIASAIAGSMIKKNEQLENQQR